jgi:hypothetical protein
MGIYALVEGKVVNRRAVWQNQGGDEETFLYCSDISEWVFSSDRGGMEPGKPDGFMSLVSAALTPDQARLSRGVGSERWHEVGNALNFGRPKT